MCLKNAVQFVYNILCPPSRTWGMFILSRRLLYPGGIALKMSVCSPRRKKSKMSTSNLAEVLKALARKLILKMGQAQYHVNEDETSFF